MKKLLSALIVVATSAVMAGCTESPTDRVGERPSDRPPAASPPTTTPPPTANPPSSSNPTVDSPSSPPSSEGSR
jgi:hypothetical protein